jgi:hypothetical protein
MSQARLQPTNHLPGDHFGFIIRPVEIATVTYLPKSPSIFNSIFTIPSYLGKLVLSDLGTLQL